MRVILSTCVSSACRVIVSLQQLQKPAVHFCGARRLSRHFATRDVSTGFSKKMKVSPYGSWESPISSQLVTQSGVGLVEVKVDINKERTDDVYWTEIRFEEKGRYVVCSFNGLDGKVQEWTPSGFNARTTVHEYGGGDFFVYNGAVYFSNFEDQVLYVQRSPSEKPEPVTDTSKKWRYADGIFCPQTKRIYCVREDHDVVAKGERKEATNTLVSINPETKEQTVLASGADFYSHPRVSPNGKQICWFQWDHPNMPWDSTEVWVADLDETGDNTVAKTCKKVAGNQESAIEPGWTSDNKLLYVSDRTEWWNLYLVASDDKHVNLLPVSSEIAGPQWSFGKTAYVADPAGSSKILTSQNSELGVVDAETKEYTKFDTGFLYNKCLALTTKGDAYFIGSGPTSFPCVVKMNINTKEKVIIKESVKNPVDSGYISSPSFITWDTTEGEKSHGIYYPPKNKDFQAPEGTLPPLLVRAHGGPTGHYFANIDLKLQYFTSRGFAVLLVNYRGSTGYGRTYRHRLKKMWGVFDMDDCCTGVEHLVKKGLVDPKKACIDGGSAGGYTTLACLTFRDTFKAGASHYGIGDLEALVADTHKFESRYMDGLLSPISEDGGKVMRERSPIHFTDRLSCPIALFQGDQDKIVPPNQAEMMYKAVKAKGLPTMYVLFEGEQHGFRKSENIQAALDGEFYFFGKVLGFEPADKGVTFKIDNLD